MFASKWNRLISLVLTVLLLSWQAVPLSISSATKRSWDIEICRSYTSVFAPSSTDNDSHKTFFECPFCYFEHLAVIFNTAKLSYVALTDRSYDLLAQPSLWLITPLYVYALSRAPPALSLKNKF